MLLYILGNLYSDISHVVSKLDYNEMLWKMSPIVYAVFMLLYNGNIAYIIIPRILL